MFRFLKIKPKSGKLIPTTGNLKVKNTEMQSIRETMEMYLNKQALNAKDTHAFRELVLAHKEVAEDMYRTTKNIHRNQILVYLNAVGEGVKLTNQLAREWAYTLEIVDCTPQQEAEFKAWLSGDCDSMPEQMPRNKYMLYYEYKTNVLLCFMSKASTFTERLCAYGIKQGYVDLVKEPIKEMMRCITVEYANSFIQHMIRTYHILDEDIMQMFSVIYAGPRKTKVEIEYYERYIKKWILEDKDTYKKAILCISKDAQDSVKRKLKKEGYDMNW